LSASAPAAAAPAGNLKEAARHGVDLSSLEPSRLSRMNFEDWKVDQSVRRLQAQVGRAARPRPTNDTGSAERPAQVAKRIDARHVSPPGPHARRRERRGGSSSFAKALLTAGAAAFAFGAVLLVWSFAQDRLDLWGLGVPGVVAGQAMMLLGFALQLETVWYNSRFAVRKLQHVDTQLDRLERTTTLMCTTHGSASQAFYAHMADQASPHLLVADLKGQVDMLARSMTRRGA
jgi:hypothetical protein